MEPASRSALRSWVENFRHPAASPTPPMPSSSTHPFRALKSRDFRLYFAGQIVSLAGTWMQRIAMS